MRGESKAYEVFRVHKGTQLVYRTHGAGVKPGLQGLEGPG